MEGEESMGTSQDLERMVVIIPSLNPCGMLLDIIKDLKQEQFVHIILVDDGSTKESKEYSSKWRFKGNFYIKDIFKSMIERSLNGDSSVREIYVLINEEKTEDLENLDRYQAFLKENKEIYRMGHCAVRKLVFYEMDFERMMYDEFINKSEYIEKDVPSYGTVALVKELQKNIKYRYKLSDKKEVFSILVTGRSIHESYFTLRLYNGTSLVFEKELSGFEKDFLIDLKNPVSCDACEIETVGKNFSDSIIIKSVDIGTKNETYEMER